MSLFITIRLLDFIDILLVSILLYKLYKLIRGTIAFNISMGIFTVYLVWLLVKALKMELISTILGQLFGVGVIALIIVFQQEIRRFLIMLGSQYKLHRWINFEKIFNYDSHGTDNSNNPVIDIICAACKEMGATRTGALIAIQRKADLSEYAATGEAIQAKLSKELLKTIFFKNSPLHDGAVILYKNTIVSARCILPVTDQRTLSPDLGLRHRAAIGMSEMTDAIIIVVSEENGTISIVRSGNIYRRLNAEELNKQLHKQFQAE
ncbi:diadenylate cyclase CdaA [Halosquirtibacter xylanolyticus]|uniref:diadenylate cyclase CdaA n=1 Tax=Halosquirtibacter xylanolyticus TaxID=3374599 RepID=UPI00374A8427|nr:diadenylate cyclase CdaA [Prolixibacteraceae bacterium]